MLSLMLCSCGGGGGGSSGTSTGSASSQDPACIGNSVLNADGTLRSRPVAYLCATYGVTTTRSDAGGNPVRMDYFVSRPPSGRAPKAMVVLIAGSNFDTRITGDADGGPATGSSGNFLVRSAQILANGDYLVATLDRPADATSGAYDEIGNVDRYRASVRHAIDILTVAHRVNTSDLDLYLIGTSRGSMSVVANNVIANGIALSSPVTRDRAESPDWFFLGDPRVPRLQATSLQRPALVLRNELDECDITPPAGAVAFADAVRARGIDTTSEAATGGFKVTAGASAADLAPCESLGFHSYMGIETLAVSSFIRWLDTRVAARGTNRHPVATFATLATARGAPRAIDLASLTTDADAEAITYVLPYAESALGGTVSIAASIVTYTPPAGIAGRSDRFIYTATDARGAVGSAVVSVDIGN